MKVRLLAHPATHGPVDFYIGFVDTVGGEVLAFLEYVFLSDPFGNVFAYLRTTETRSETIGEEKYSYGLGLGELLARAFLMTAAAVLHSTLPCPSYVTR